MVTYNLLDYKFNSYAYFDMISTLDENKFKEIILKTYKEHKNDLLDYIIVL